MHSFGLTLRVSVAPDSVWCGVGSIEKKKIGLEERRSLHAADVRAVSTVMLTVIIAATAHRDRVRVTIVSGVRHGHRVICVRRGMCTLLGEPT